MQENRKNRPPVGSSGDGPKFPGLGMSDKTAKKVLDFLDMNYSFLQSFFSRIIFFVSVFTLGVFLGLTLWDHPTTRAGRVTLSPLGYVPAILMAYSMWMSIDAVFQVIDRRRAKKAAAKEKQESLESKDDEESDGVSSTDIF